MDTTATDCLEREARRRAGAKLGWYTHAMVYIAVNLLLATLSFMSGRAWAIYPALGWGIGLAVHRTGVFLATGGTLGRLVERERRALRQQQGPW